MSRHTNRLATSDDEEENEVQHEPVPDRHASADEEEDEAQAKRSKRNSASKSKAKGSKPKVEKSKKTRQRQDASDNEEDMGCVGLAPFDRDEFLATARAIPPDGAETLSGVISDLQIVMDQVEASGYELVTDTAVAVEEVSGNTEEGQEVRRMPNFMFVAYY
jgi:hypothetical protein